MQLLQSGFDRSNDDDDDNDDVIVVQSKTTFGNKTKLSTLTWKCYQNGITKTVAFVTKFGNIFVCFATKFAVHFFNQS